MNCFGSTETIKPIKRKLVIVGDGACGKTCLLTVFCKGTFPIEEYIPTVFDNSVKDVTINGKPIICELWDTAGQEDFNRLRTLSYPDSDAVLLAYSVDIPDSLENIYGKWVPEVKRFCPGLPIILVACKIDLRQDEKYSESMITREQGEEVAHDIGAYAYVECSALSGQGVNSVFTTALKSTMKKNRTIGCQIM